MSGFGATVNTQQALENNGGVHSRANVQRMGEVLGDLAHNDLEAVTEAIYQDEIGTSDSIKFSDMSSDSDWVVIQSGDQVGNYRNESSFATDALANEADAEGGNGTRVEDETAAQRFAADKADNIVGYDYSQHDADDAKPAPNVHDNGVQGDGLIVVDGRVYDINKVGFTMKLADISFVEQNRMKGVLERQKFEKEINQAATRTLGG